ncbi:MAG: 3' terminal RNA ribose 2'-O-methyltransferase Hen1 [Armatimonadetes bacterium]|nr:3' terminal RNA ribose 2'-O-methyltransferase Hen1 [Armatimonadota bacterium]
MILKISTTHQPAADLGYLLHKNPTRLHEETFPFGKGYVLFPEISDEKAEAALLLDVDPIGLVRGGSTYDQYVNDRPYAASSFISSAMLAFFSTAMSGRSKERQEVADQAIPLQFELPVIRMRSGGDFVRSLLEPLGYELEFQPIGGKYFNLKGSITTRIRDFLTHLYILIPVIDDDKHYYVDRNEIDKLTNRAKDWLPSHPMKDAIIQKFLRYDRILTKEAIARLAEFEPDLDEVDLPGTDQEEKIEKKISLHTQRLEHVTAKLAELGATSVVDLGCGEGRLIQLLLKQRQFKKILGVDVCVRSLEFAARRLHLSDAGDALRNRLELVHGSLMYRDSRISGFDAAAIVEVIEHLDLPRLAAFERVVFEFAKPQNVVLTTPNIEYNAVFETMAPGQLRHNDHRFEWTRAEFQAWCDSICQRFGYRVAIEGIGEPHPEYGSPSIMGVFTR